MDVADPAPASRGRRILVVARLKSGVALPIDPGVGPETSAVAAREPVRGSFLFAPARDDELASLAVLRGVPREAVEGRLLACPVLELEPGEALIREGDERGELYLVLSGLLEVRLDGGVPLARIPAGQTAGELAVIDPRPATATVTAIERTRVLVVDEETFWATVAASHQVALNMLRLLASRMRASNVRVGEKHAEARSLEALARVDALTGLANRRSLDEVLPRLVGRASFDRAPLSVIAIDVDHFKRVNDTWGHATGDRVLVALGALLTHFLRPTDLACRFGGEEIVIVLPATPPEGAMVVAERIRRAIKGERIESTCGTVLPPITISLGVTTRTPGDDAASLLRRADQLLYEAKRSGRDRVVPG